MRPLTFTVLAVLLLLLTTPLLSQDTATENAGEQQEAQEPNDSDDTAEQQPVNPDYPDAHIPTAAEQTELLRAHNVWRCVHDAPLMTWNEERASKAQDWANLCSAKPSDRVKYGENLWWDFNADTYNLTVMVQTWYNQINKFDFRKPAGDSNTDRFTQIIWRDSTKLGCGMCIRKERRGSQRKVLLLVCQYSPKGNIDTPAEFRANVADVSTTKTTEQCQQEVAVAMGLNTTATGASQRKHHFMGFSTTIVGFLASFLFANMG